MADLSQMSLLLQNVYNVNVGIKPRKLKNLSELVARYAKAPLYPWQPVVGESVFSHESGIHANGTIKCGEAFEPFSPESVGRERKIVIGKHTGKHAIKFVLEKEGFTVNESCLSLCLEKVRMASIEAKSSLSNTDLISIYQNVLSCSERAD